MFSYLFFTPFIPLLIFQQGITLLFLIFFPFFILYFIIYVILFIFLFYFLYLFLFYLLYILLADFCDKILYFNTLILL